MSEFSYDNLSTSILQTELSRVQETMAILSQKYELIVTVLAQRAIEGMQETPRTAPRFVGDAYLHVGPRDENSND